MIRKSRIKKNEMRGMVSPVWHKLYAAQAVPPRELRLEYTLLNGQCFGWERRQPAREVCNDPVWVGVLGKRVLALRQTETDCLFRCIGSLSDETAEEAIASVRSELVDYFQLDTKLEPLYQLWSRTDMRMQVVSTTLPGMRIIRQEPEECLFSFICSSNNNIGRIGGMLRTIRRQYGRPIPVSDPAFLCADEDQGVGGEPEPEPGYFTFPGAETLAAASEDELRSLGLGYRAGFVQQSAALLLEKGVPWLYALRQVQSAKEVRKELLAFRGVGPKVADCVALFSLDQSSAIPVDTHVWEIACRDFDPTLRECSSLTPTVYDRVGDLFRERYGAHAGWAHSVLFAAELPQFIKELPDSLRQEMVAFKEEQKALRLQETERKQKAKEQKLSEAAAAEASAREAESPSSTARARSRKTSAERAEGEDGSEGMEPKTKTKSRRTKGPQLVD